MPVGSASDHHLVPPGPNWPVIYRYFDSSQTPPPMLQPLPYTSRVERHGGRQLHMPVSFACPRAGGASPLRNGEILARTKRLRCAAKCPRAGDTGGATTRTPPLKTPKRSRSAIMVASRHLLVPPTRGETPASTSAGRSGAGNYYCGADDDQRFDFQALPQCVEKDRQRRGATHTPWLPRIAPRRSYRCLTMPSSIRLMRR